MIKAIERLRRLMEHPDNYVPTPARAVTLYHGTAAANAQRLLADGWKPGMAHSGSHRGQIRYLYLTTTPENALWYAHEKGAETVLEVRDVPLTFLHVDPEDGTAPTVEGELALSLGLPGNLVLQQALSAAHFSLYRGPFRL